MTAAPGAPSLEELLERRSRRLRFLVLVVAIGSSLGVAVYALTRLLPPQPYGIAEDFRDFYAAAHLIAAGRSPYNLAALQTAEQLFRAYPHLQPTLDNFAYLPFTAMLLDPVSRLPFWTSYVVFTLFGAAAALLTLGLFARDLGWSKVAVLLGAVLISWVALLGFSSGQFDALMFAVLAGSMLLAWHDRPLLAGLVMGLIWVKPDLLWPAPIFLFLALWQRPRKAWWFALGFGAVSSACLAASAPWLPQWWAEIHRFAASVGVTQPDLGGLSGLLGAAPRGWGLGTGLAAPGPLAVVAVALLAMAVFGGWMMLSADWDRVSPVGRIAWGVGLPVGVWLLATPYAHPNDDLLLLPLLMLTLGHDARRVHGLGLGLAVLAVAWLLLIWPIELVPWPWGLAALVVLASLLWRWRTNPLFTGFGAGLSLLTIAILPPVWGFHTLEVGLTPIAVMVLVVEGARTCWMEVGGAGTGPAYITEPGTGPGVAAAATGG